MKTLAEILKKRDQDINDILDKTINELNALEEGLREINFDFSVDTIKRIIKDIEYLKM